MTDPMNIDTDSLAPKLEADIREMVFKKMKKKGVVIGISGGIDSSVCLAICVKALGKDRVYGILMPEKDCKDQTTILGKQIAEHFQIKYTMEDITSILESSGCYKRRNDAIRELVPNYDENWECKVALPDLDSGDRFSISQLVVRSPEGETTTHRMRSSQYLTVIASSNFKQRTRKMMEYYYGDKLNYAVVGTPNRLEYELGFFVKNGDGAADIKPIAHLYKSQVYQLAHHYDLPKDIIEQVPTTDTFPMEQTQEEFYFSLPLKDMDLALNCYNNGEGPECLASLLDTSLDRAQWIFNDIERKKRKTTFLHTPPVIFGEIKIEKINSK